MINNAHKNEQIIHYTFSLGTTCLKLSHHLFETESTQNISGGSFQIYFFLFAIGCTLDECRTASETDIEFALYHFISEPAYKSQRIKLLDVITRCNQLNLNALN